jgi:hypothetical protein
LQSRFAFRARRRIVAAAFDREDLLEWRKICGIGWVDFWISTKRVGGRPRFALNFLGTDLPVWPIRAEFEEGNEKMISFIGNEKWQKCSLGLAGIVTESHERKRTRKGNGMAETQSDGHAQDLLKPF